MGSALGPRPPWDESKEPILRSPRVVTGFILAFVAVHVGTQFLTQAQYDELINNFALIPERFAALEWSGVASESLMGLVPLVSYAFLHGDFTHLLFNSIWFLIFATAVARRYATARSEIQWRRPILSQSPLET